MDEKIAAVEAAGNLEETIGLEMGRAIYAAGGSVPKAADLLGIGRATLYRRIADAQVRGLCFLHSKDCRNPDCVAHAKKAVAA